MSAPKIRVDHADDPERFLATDLTVWFLEVPDVPASERLVGLPEDQRFAALVEGADPATYPGIYGVFPLRLSVPGPSGRGDLVSCAGLTWVGVHPDHRRRGVLTAMMRHHLEHVHASPGVHVSALHASEPGIYGRHGYGLASLEHEVVLGRGTTLRAPHLEEATQAVTTQTVTASDAGTPERLHACHLARAEPGEVVGEPGYYRQACLPLPEDLRGKEPWRVLFARRDGADVGYAMFRREHKWERARPAGEVSVRSLVGDPATRLALLRRLVDLDLMGSVRVGHVAADDPLLTWAGGPRGTTDIATYDSLWVRLVDLPEALAERSWATPCDVVVEVADASAPWNAGVWRIRAEGGSATVERATAEPDLLLDVSALGAAYLGGGNLLALQRAGQVEERRAGAVAELWRSMRTDLPPSAAMNF